MGIQVSPSPWTGSSPWRAATTAGICPSTGCCSAASCPTPSAAVSARAGFVPAAGQGPHRGGPVLPLGSGHPEGVQGRRRPAAVSALLSNQYRPRYRLYSMPGRLLCFVHSFSPPGQANGRFPKGGKSDGKSYNQGAAGPGGSAGGWKSCCTASTRTPPSSPRTRPCRPSSGAMPSSTRPTTPIF